MLHRALSYEPTAPPWPESKPSPDPRDTAPEPVDSMAAAATNPAGSLIADVRLAVDGEAEAPGGSDPWLDESLTWFADALARMT